nr:uncharacterized protein LOC109398556 [Aedes albopictus]
MSAGERGKYSNICTAVRWIVNRPESQNPELTLAQKLVRASRNTPSQGASSSSATGLLTPAAAFKIKQAQLMVSAVTQKKLPTWREVIGDSVLIEFKLKFAVNFSYDVFDVISEGQQFEHLGFSLSPVVRTAIMRKEQLFTDVEHVTKMVNDYNELVLRLAAPEIHFLRGHLYEVETIIQAGLGRFTWQSFNIPAYCERCQQFMKSLSSMVSQIGHISSDIKSQIDKLESFSMFEMKVDPAKEKRSAAAAEIVLKTPSQPKEPQPHHHHHHHHHHRHSSSHQQKITAEGPSAAAGAAAAQAEDNSAGEQRSTSTSRNRRRRNRNASPSGKHRRTTGYDPARTTSRPWSWSGTRKQPNWRNFTTQ